MLKDNLKAARLKAGMTLDEVAKKVGVSRQTIQRYESGVINNVPSDKIEKMAEALDTTPEYLMGWKKEVTLNFDLERDVKKSRLLDKEQTGLIDTYDTLPIEGRKELLSYLLYLKHKYSKFVSAW
ncbi:MAG: helix-turn-helix transcriptional regulator [Selenomonadaceae bacterium]|nr:helix-turn-helix transcriptional regulator [Selenomonadaceae bacterium]